MFSLPAVPSLKGAWPAWRAEVWHEPVSDRLQPGAVHMDTPPLWAQQTIHSMDNHTRAFDIIQLHVTVPGGHNAIAAKTVQLAAVDLPL